MLQEWGGDRDEVGIGTNTVGMVGDGENLLSPSE